MKKIILLVVALLNGCAVYTTPEGEAALGGLVVGAVAGALIYGAIDGHGCHNCYRRYNHGYHQPRPYYRPHHYRY